MQIYKKEFFSEDVEELISSTNTSIRTRYDSKIRLRLKDNIIIIRNLKKPDLVAEQSDRDIIHRVTLLEDKRPDLIALKYYGDARLYWVILGANGYREKDQVNKGVLIRIPAMNSLYGYDGLIVR